MRTIKSISFSDLKRIFNGRKFTRRLTQAANETLKYWDETQFNVVRTLSDGKLIYGDVVSKSDVLDEPDSSVGGFFLDGVEELIEKENLNIYAGEVFPLIVYHTHPSTSSSDPSPDDISGMAILRSWTYDLGYGPRYDNRPLFIIGSVPNRKRLDLLVLQEKLDTPMGEFIAEQIPDFVGMDRDYDPKNNDTIARLYDLRPELNAALLSYQRNGNGLYRISNEELAKLERFSYFPTMLPEKS